MIPELNVWPEDENEKVHQGSLETLWEVGAGYLGGMALHVRSENGASVDLKIRGVDTAYA